MNVPVDFSEVTVNICGNAVVRVAPVAKCFKILVWFFRMAKS